MFLSTFCSGWLSIILLKLTLQLSFLSELSPEWPLMVHSWQYGLFSTPQNSASIYPLSDSKARSACYGIWYSSTPNSWHQFLSQFVHAAITKFHKLSTLKTTKLLSHCSESREVQDQGSSRFWWLLRACFLVHRLQSLCSVIPFLRAYTFGRWLGELLGPRPQRPRLLTASHGDRQVFWGDTRMPSTPFLPSPCQ